MAWEEGEWLFQLIVILQQESSAYVEVVCVVLQGLSIYVFKAPTEALTIILHKIKLGSVYRRNNRDTPNECGSFNTLDGFFKR